MSFAYFHVLMGYVIINTQYSHVVSTKENPHTLAALALAPHSILMCVCAVVCAVMYNSPY